MKRRLYTTPTSFLDVEIEGGMLHWQSGSYIDPGIIDRNHERGRDAGRAPLGDSHGGWYKEAEIPLSIFLEKFPADAWEDQKAISRFLNDPDNRAWKCNGGRAI